MTERIRTDRVPLPAGTKVSLLAAALALVAAGYAFLAPISIPGDDNVPFRCGSAVDRAAGKLATDFCGVAPATHGLTALWLVAAALVLVAGGLAFFGTSGSVRGYVPEHAWRARLRRVLPVPARATALLGALLLLPAAYWLLVPAEVRVTGNFPSQCGRVIDPGADETIRRMCQGPLLANRAKAIGSGLAAGVVGLGGMVLFASYRDAASSRAE